MRAVLEFPKKIVSGGQTGADRAALDFALGCGMAIGGWVPKGRLAEDGAIPDRYVGLLETNSADFDLRTVLNVRDSDATLILSHGPLTGGSLLTLREAVATGRPLLHLDFDQLSPEEAAGRLRGWLQGVGPSTLNVAGPRASKDSRIAAAAQQVLELALLCE